MVLGLGELEAYQTIILPGTLYYIKNNSRGVEREDSWLHVGANIVNIHYSMLRPAVPATPLPDMDLWVTAFTLGDVFAFVPNFLYLEVTAGTDTMVVSSLELEVVT